MANLNNDLREHLKLTINLILVDVEQVEHSHATQAGKDETRKLLRIRMLEQAGKTRRAESDLTQAARILAAAPLVRTPPGPVSTSMSTSIAVAYPATSVVRPEVPEVRAHPRKLKIGTGQVG
ncbi:hypothetical protein [Burkholderia sp. Ed8]|uniref:hypothetical protein n=1 Tax=Burkholderia sp. Ed8 TaxID=3112957 RepID=UPI00345CDF6D